GVEVRLFVAEQSAGGLGGAAGELFVLVGQLGFAAQPEHLGVGGHEADQSAAGLLSEVLGLDELARPVEVVEIGLRSGGDDDELGASVVVEVELVGVLQQLDGLLRLAAAAFGVGDESEVVVRPGDPTVGAQLSHGLVVLLDVVGGDAERLADDGDSSGPGHRCLRVLVRPVGVEVEQAAGGDEVLGDHGRVFLVQGPQLAEDLLVEFAAGDAFGDLGFLDAGAAGALLACVFAGVGLARGAAIVVTAAAATTTVVIATLALVTAPTVVVPALTLVPASTVVIATFALLAAAAVVVPALTLVAASAVVIAATVLPGTAPTVVITTLTLVPASAIVIAATILPGTTAAIIIATLTLVPASAIVIAATMPPAPTAAVIVAPLALVPASAVCSTAVAAAPPPRAGHAP